MENEEQTPAFKSGFVALVGRPNVGKSTLINAFMQQKIAIVTPRPQTTRTRQLGIITEPHYQMIFIDTPGLIKNPRHKLDAFMVETAVEAFTDADVILWLTDSTSMPGPEDQAIAAQLNALGKNSCIILGMNKLDAVEAKDVLPRSDAYRNLVPKAAWLMFSAKTQVGMDELLDMLVTALPEGPQYYPDDQITDVYMRDIAAELIREQIMLQLRDEVPYGTAVQILEFKERDNGTIYISANIIVERDTHKRIIIGAKGAQLRQIGAQARQEIERMLEGKVYLELWIKVEEKWRRNERALRRFGYSSE